MPMELLPNSIIRPLQPLLVDDCSPADPSFLTGGEDRCGFAFDLLQDALIQVPEYLYGFAIEGVHIFNNKELDVPEDIFLLPRTEN